MNPSELIGVSADRVAKAFEKFYCADPINDEDRRILRAFGEEHDSHRDRCLEQFDHDETARKVITQRRKTKASWFDVQWISKSLFMPLIFAHKHRLVQLEERIKALEARALPKWCGVWVAKGYQEGSLVTRDGSLWLATTDTSDRPGDGGAWRLIVKGRS